MRLPLRHQIVDVVVGRKNLVVVEHQLPEMEIQQQLTDIDQISRTPQGYVRQSPSDRFMNFVRVNIELIIEDVHLQDQQLQRMWGGFPPTVEHFDELVQQIINGQTILAASDESYQEDGRASAGWALYEPCEEYDDQGRVVLSAKVLFGSTILVSSRLDSNSAY